jgi:hypothetical protein
MTRTKLFAATAVIWSIILVAAGATFRDARPNAVKPLLEDDSGEPLMKKGDRLPLSVPIPLATAAQPEVTPPVSQSQQLPPATEDDIRQAEAEHHRHREICPHGRTYFTVERHQYWRCRL